MTTKNILNSKGSKVANQFIITIENGDKMFKSYNSNICKIIERDVFLDPTYWDYSKTTIKYLCKFLGINSKKEILHWIDSGIYKFANLN